MPITTRTRQVRIALEYHFKLRKAEYVTQNAGAVANAEVGMPDIAPTTA